MRVPEILTLLSTLALCLLAACQPAEPAPPAPAAQPLSSGERGGAVGANHTVRLMSSNELLGDGSCLAAADAPCPASPATVPSCDAAAIADALSLAEATAQRDTLLGQPVAVRHRLSLTDAACTWMACTTQCCNSCAASLTLRADDAEIVLGAGPTGRARDLLQCSGDESVMCCGTAIPEAEVLARGTLRSENGVYFLDDASLCMP